MAYNSYSYFYSLKYQTISLSSEWTGINLQKGMIQKPFTIKYKTPLSLEKRGFNNIFLIFLTF